MSANVQKRRNTRKKTSKAYDTDCHFIINMKVDILKVTLFLVKDYNLKLIQLINFVN